MQKLEIKEKKLLQLPYFYHEKTNEAVILEYNDQELVKIYNYIDKNKIFTLELIDQYREVLEQIEELLLFQKVVYVNNTEIGILLPKGYKENAHDYFINSKTCWNDKIMVLQNLGKLLEKLSKLREQNSILATFFIGDLQEKNVLIDRTTKKIQIIDLDSCKIKTNKPFPTKYLEFIYCFNYVKQNLHKKYIIKGDTCIPNESSDLYCYILIILKQLFHIDITYLSIEQFYKEMYKIKETMPEELWTILINIYNIPYNKNPYKLLDTIEEVKEKTLKK